jgi:undecaprenyl diphosphate synthase
MEKKVKEISSIQHVAIIMDGNGRWAKMRGLSRLEGHKAGAKSIERIVDVILKYNIKYVTLYAFSTENWKRPKEEVFGLMKLLREFLEENFKDLNEKGIRLRTIGRTNDLPLVTRKLLKKTIEATKNNTNGQLIIALSYGGRTEIVDAVTNIVKDIKEKKISSKQINESLISSYLYAPDIPDPELMIRTSGEFRISNFLLWQLSYSELWITDTLWPDFDEKDFIKAINNYKNRDRRFGGV